MTSGLAASVVRRLDVADLDAVARLHMAAFPAAAITRMGQEAARRFYLSLLAGPHVAVPLGAFDGPRLVGFCFGGLWRDAEVHYLRENLLFLAARVLTRPALLREPFFRDRIRTGIRILLPRRLRGGSGPASEPELGNDFGIQSIAVDPSEQGRGIGGQLMRRTQEIARDMGFVSMHLSVHANNAQAIAFYEGSGWRKLLAGGIWRGVMVRDVN